jgi:hypothetical protein
MALGAVALMGLSLTSCRIHNSDVLSEGTVAVSGKVVISKKPKVKSPFVCTSSPAPKGAKPATTAKLPVSKANANLPKANLQIAVTNTDDETGVGSSGSNWGAIFVLLDPGSNLKLTSLLGQSGSPPQQVDTHEYAFGPLMRGSTRTLTAELQGAKAGTATVKISAWGGDDPKDVPSHPPSATCSFAVR